jgi:hypothetical protein
MLVMPRALRHQLHWRWRGYRRTGLCVLAEQQGAGALRNWVQTQEHQGQILEQLADYLQVFIRLIRWAGNRSVSLIY